MSNIEKEWYLGIDFGTSNTCVIAYEAKEGKLYSGDLTKGISDTFLNISSCISQDINPLNSNERLYYVGEEASKHPVLRPFKGLKTAAREITPNNGLFGKNSIEYPFDDCGLNSTLEMGHDDYSLTVTVKELVLQFLKKVLQIGNKKFGISKDTVKKIVIGCPATKKRGQDGCKESYEDTLKALLAECFTGNNEDMSFIKKICVEAEPELAGVTYLFSESKREDKKVLVIDIGGGTTDFSVLEYKKGQVEATNIGSCEVAGNTIDKIIFDLLPAGITHSKAQCRQWKEHLFADELDEGGIATIKPYEIKNISRINTEQQIDGKDLFLCYNHPSESFIKNVVIGEKITTEVFDKIEEALDVALTNNGITGINTIFFVGGTSIITPLREKLVATVANTQKSYCVADFDCETDVVTMFGNQTRTLKADWDTPLTVTCYNAVAIGACIKAMGEDICIKPKVEYTSFYAILDLEKKIYDVSSNDIFIKTTKGVPFKYIIHDKQKVSDWKANNKFYGRTYETMKFVIGGETYVYTIQADLLQQVQRGLLIVLKLNHLGIACEVYDCETTEAIVKQIGIDKVIKNLSPIEIRKTQEGAN